MPLYTHCGQGQRGLPLVIALRSLQMVAPDFSLNFWTIWLAILGVPAPLLIIPAEITAPIIAPQVPSIPPIPAAKPDERFLSVFSSTFSLSE